MNTRAYPIGRARAMIALAFMAVVCGWGITQPSKSIQLLPLLVAVPAMVVVFGEFGLKPLFLWAPLEVVTYPWEGLPTKNLDFSRVWIIGMSALLLILPRSRAASRASSRLLWALAVLAIVLGVRAAATPAGTQGGFAWGMRLWLETLVLPLILFAVVRRVVAVRPEATERIVLSLVVAGLFLSLAGLAEKRAGIVLLPPRVDYSVGGIRINGPYDTPETYGLCLVICLAATLLWLQMKQRAPKVQRQVIGVMVLEMVAIFYTYFRVAWISAIIVLVTPLFLRPEGFRRPAKTMKMMAVLAALGGLIFFALEQRHSTAVASRVDNTNNIYVRFGAWQQGIAIFRSDPVFGVGANRYIPVASQLATTSVHGVKSVPDPHNSFVLVLAEDGAIGFAALILVGVAIVPLIRSLRRHARSTDEAVLVGTIAGVTFAYLAFSLTLAMLTFGPSNQMFAMVLGLGAGVLDRHASEASFGRGSEARLGGGSAPLWQGLRSPPAPPWLPTRRRRPGSEPT